MEVTKPIKVGNVWTNLISGATGESVNFEEVTEWVDGTPMDDSKVDGVIYRKLPSSVGGGYVRRVYEGAIKTDWVQSIDPTGVADSSEELERMLTIDNVELTSGGIYRATLTIPSGRRLFVNGTATIRAAQPIDRIVEQETGSSVYNIIFDGAVGDGTYAGQGIRTRIKPGGGLTEIVGCTFRNFYGVDVSRGWASGIQAIGGDYIINIESCVFDNIWALENGTQGDSPGMARGVYATSITKGRIVNCIFNNIGGTDPLEGWEDSDCIVIQTPNDENTQPQVAAWTISDNRFLNIKKRAIKLQASGIFVSQNYIQSSYAGGSGLQPLAAIQNWGVNNKFQSNNIELVAGTAVIESGSGSQWINNSIKVTDLSESFNTIQIITSTGGSSYPPPSNLLIKGNLLHSKEAIYVNAGSNNKIQDNDVYGNIRVQGNTVSRVYIEDNNIHLQSEVTGTRLNGVQALIPTTTNDLFFINRNRISGRVSSGVFLGLSSQSAAHVTEMEVLDNMVTGYSVEKVRVQATGFPENTLKISHVDNKLITRPSTDIYDLNALYDVTGANSFNLRNGGSIRATWHVNQFTNAPRQDEGFFIVQDIPVGNTDHIQVGVKMNQSSDKNLVTNSYVAIRVYSELGTTAGGTTGWSPWFRILTDDWRSRVLNLSAATINDNQRSVFKSWAGDSDATVNISGVGTSVLTLTNTHLTDPINFTLASTIFDVTGTDTVVIPPNSSILVDYVVTGGTNRFAYIKGNKVSDSPDSATPVSSAYDQAEVQAILDELRDLKTKMRAAGLLAT